MFQALCPDGVEGRPQTTTPRSPEKQHKSVSAQAAPDRRTHWPKARSPSGGPHNHSGYEPWASRPVMVTVAGPLMAFQPELPVPVAIWAILEVWSGLRDMVM